MFPPCRRRVVPARPASSCCPRLLFLHLQHSVRWSQEESHPRRVCRPPSWIFPGLWNPWNALPPLQPQTPQICLYRRPERLAAVPGVQHRDRRRTHTGLLQDRGRVVASVDRHRPPQATGGVPHYLPYKGQPGPGPTQKLRAGGFNSRLVYSGSPTILLRRSKRGGSRVNRRCAQGRFIGCGLRRESLHPGKDEVHAPQCVGPAAVQVSVQIWFQPDSCVSHTGKLFLTCYVMSWFSIFFFDLLISNYSPVIW